MATDVAASPVTDADRRAVETERQITPQRHSTHSINYGYAILETEATIALQALGFDPGIGILHTDKCYRGSLAHDLMEPVRPIVDGLVLGLLERRPLRRGDVYETREGVCWVGPPLAQELGQMAPALREPLQFQARGIAALMLGETDIAKATHGEAGLRPVRNTRGASRCGRRVEAWCLSGGRENLAERCFKGIWAAERDFGIARRPKRELPQATPRP